MTGFFLLLFFLFWRIFPPTLLFFAQLQPICIVIICCWFYWVAVILREDSWWELLKIYGATSSSRNHIVQINEKILNKIFKAKFFHWRSNLFGFSPLFLWWNLITNLTIIVEYSKIRFSIWSQKFHSYTLNIMNLVQDNFTYCKSSKGSAPIFSNFSLFSETIFWSIT